MNDSDLEHLLSSCPERRGKEKGTILLIFQIYIIAVSNIDNALFASLPL